MDNKVTEGKLYKEVFKSNGVVITNGIFKFGCFVNTDSHIDGAENPCDYAQADLLNESKFIVAAVNACKEINPDNPQVVAESIGEMKELLTEVATGTKVSHLTNHKIEQLLNKLGGK